MKDWTELVLFTIKLSSKRAFNEPNLVYLNGVTFSPVKFGYWVVSSRSNQSEDSITDQLKKWLEDHLSDARMILHSPMILHSQIVDPNGYSQKTLSEEYINLYWAEFKKFANVEAYDQDKCKEAFASNNKNGQRE
ncbi:hypothetical protein AAHA92_05846 [Salvia divinorum]|uniref:Uncharacterized protein n=1 Tax=Salvia divinorum TaxID=28513 RepID=A0ABD1I3R1_SALDI